MDARLALVLTVLLVGTSYADQVFNVNYAGSLSDEDVDEMMRNSDTSDVAEVAHMIGMAVAEGKYQELKRINWYGLYADCSAAKLEKRKNICAKYSGKINEYCEHCVKELINKCLKHPSVITSIDEEYFNGPIAALQRALDQFLSENKISHSISREMYVKAFLSDPCQQAKLEWMKAGCEKYIQKYNGLRSFFENNVSPDDFQEFIQSLEDPEKSGFRRTSLFGSIEECKFIVNFLDDSK
jgi:nitrogen regulatory protein PII-like uncharacterized protein